MSPSSSIPVPLPTISSRLLPVTTVPIAADGVVLPIPISPVPRISTPLLKNSAARLNPVKIAFSASWRVMAGPFVKFAVPFAILCTKKRSPPSIEPGSNSGIMPISTTQTSAPTCRQIAFIPAPPFRKVITIAPVTSCGKALTPSLTTP